jgi:glutamyl-tRNA synthetase
LIGKNRWFNHQHLIKQDEDLAHLRSIVASKEVPENVLIKIVSLIKERAHFVSEFWELSDFFFVAPSEWRLKLESGTSINARINSRCG